MLENLVVNLIYELPMPEGVEVVVVVGKEEDKDWVLEEISRDPRRRGWRAKQVLAHLTVEVKQGV